MVDARPYAAETVLMRTLMQLETVDDRTLFYTPSVDTRDDSIRRLEIGRAPIDFLSIDVEEFDTVGCEIAATPLERRREAEGSNALIENDGSIRLSGWLHYCGVRDKPSYRGKYVFYRDDNEGPIRFLRIGDSRLYYAEMHSGILYEAKLIPHPEESAF